MNINWALKKCLLSFRVAKAHDYTHCYTHTHTHTHSEHEIIQIWALKCNLFQRVFIRDCTRSCDLSTCCIASDEPVQIREVIRKMKMEIQKKIWTSRYNEIGSGPPGKSQVKCVSVGNVHPTPPIPLTSGTSENDSFL